MSKLVLDFSVPVGRTTFLDGSDQARLQDLEQLFLLVRISFVTGHGRKLLVGDRPALDAGIILKIFFQAFQRIF